MERILRNTSANLAVTFYADEVPTDPSGNTATVTVTRQSTGALVGSADQATTRIGTGQYRYTLPAQTALDHFTLKWKGNFGAVQTIETHAEVVGARLFSLADLRAYDPAFVDSATYTLEKLELARAQVEDEFEQITGRSFIQRHGYSLLTGGGSAVLRRLDEYDVTAVLAGTVAGVALTGGEIAALTVRQGRLLARATGVWTELAPVMVHYEYGLIDIDATIRDAALLRARTRLNDDLAGIPEVASSFDGPEGASFDLARPGLVSTGIPQVDAVLSRWMTDEKRAALAALNAAATA